MRQQSIMMRDQLPHSVMNILESKLKILCDICNHQVSQPKICPSCNQIFCHQCLAKYHQTYKNCPMCHEKLPLNQFLDCDCHRFIDYFRQQLKEFKLVTKSSDKKLVAYETQNYNNVKQPEQEEKCHLHDIPLKYFCESCSKPICSDCGMMSDQHKDHKFTRINDIYAKIKQKLNNELANLSRKIMDYQQNSLLSKKKLQKLQIQYMHIKRYTQQYYLLLIEKFQQQIKAKTICLKQVQQKNNKDIEFYELCRDGICEEIERKSRNQLIAQTDKILSSFTINSCQPCQPLKIEESFETIKELMPDYNNFSYSLTNFSQATGSIVYSDPFIINGVEWRLKIYPKGNGVAKGKYLSVFVQMSKAEKNQKKYEYKIQLLNHQMSAQNIRREYCSAFDIGQCWGYNQFILLEELEHGFLVDDTLHFIMGIRNSDYRTLSQDQSNYIFRLQASIRQKQQQRQNQVQQTNIIDDLDHLSYANQNETKFLKFLENSSSYGQEKINQKVYKEKSKQNKNEQMKQQQKQDKKSKQKQQQKKYNKKQQEKIQNQKITFKNFAPELKEQERTTNNLQQQQKLNQRKSLHNEFLLTEQQLQSQQENYLKLSLSQQKIKTKQEDLQRTKKKRVSNNQQEKNQSKQQQKGSSSGNKFISLKQLKSQKFISNNQSKSSIIAEVKPQKKQREKEYLQKQEDSNLKKYEFYFNDSKKQLKKQQYKQSSQNKKQLQKEYNPLDSSKKIKDSKLSSSELKQYRKVQQSKSQVYSNPLQIKDYQKYEQKRQKINIKYNKNPKNSPSKIKDFIDENQTRKKQISSILQQSKKLQGINQMTKNSFIIDNNSSIKQSVIIKSPTKNNQFRMEQKQQRRKNQRKFQQDEDY